ncbi:NADPH-dependent 1-acyldihydroxyacetone phosphate reductase [Colletotrichum higginsianum]|uniref:NADPH-dependent 1-acyldihydroxyacetone phosphate reductase n=1 Tax=Colletotrichum higginsianum TaxID=80884 RepID=A0A4T0W201_9PEZI|nr:NADPH-dependent 1-acyldihydroxyacetone phosphate reductase [Colletotrichum higginsianum]
MPQQQKFALVTGCGRGGIGEALVTEYTRRGVHAIATVLPHEASDHLSDAGITFFPLDVTNEQSIIDLKAALQKLTSGNLDILVNCAGIAYTMTAIDTDVGAVQRMFDINLFGPMRMVHHLHEMIIQAKGTIVNIGSIGGIIPFMYGSSYNASKAGLHHWGNTLRVEMAPLGVKVITVISGEVSTNILKNDAHRKLPEGPITPFSPRTSSGTSCGPRGATDRFDYATNVVAQSLKSSPPSWFWYGSFTGVTRFLDMFCWRTVWDTLMWNMFSLDKLKQAHSTIAKKLAY